MDKNSKYEDMEKRIKTLENTLYNYSEKNNELKDHYYKYSTIIKNANEAILVIQEGKLKLISSLAAKISGFSQNETPNRSFLEWVHPDDQEMVTENHLKRLKGEKVPDDYDIRIIDKTQKVRWMNIRPVAIEWEGQPAVLVFMTDISRRKQSEEELRISEAKYKAVLDGIEDGYYEVDLTGKFIFISDKLSEIIKISRKELLGKGNREFNTPETAKKIFNTFNNVYRTGKPAKIESFQFFTKEKDGIRKVDLELSVSLMKDQYGDPVGFRGIVRDVSERIKSEKAIKESEEKYRSFLEDFQGIAYKGMIATWKILFFHGTTEKITGYTADELSSEKMNWKNLIHPEDLINLPGSEEVSMIPGYSIEREYRIIRKDNQIRWVKEYCKNICGDNGKPEFVQGTIYDITQRKQAEEQRVKLEAQFQQAQKMEAIGILAGGIAHDFNNLLMGILGYKSIMMSKIDTSHPHYKHLDGIEKCVESAIELTRQLLGFARGGKYEVEPTDLNKLVKDQNLMFSRTKKEITIHSKYEENLYTAEVDRGQIEQILMNIYVNAWQAMPDGGELHIQTENVKVGDDYKQPFHVTPGKYVKISVTDTGIGMDEETKKQIFDPFFTTKEKERGTGMGLSSAYGIIKNHGGFITVYSEPGEGATFNIFIPASRKKVKKHKKPTERLKRGSGTILIIDDEQMILDVGKSFLKELGYKALTAKNGNEGLEIYKKYQEKIDMVILDMIMPGTSGSDAYDSLKEINHNIKVLLSSGYSINGKATEILERGCNGFIQKPFTLEQLSQKMSEILSKK